MRRNKIIARILFIFSIANVVLAAPALLRQRRLVTDRADDEPTGDSEQDSGLASSTGPAHQDLVVPAAPAAPSQPEAGSEHGTPPGSEQDWEHASSNGPVHQDWTVPATPPPSEAGSEHGSDEPGRQGSVSYSYSPAESPPHSVSYSYSPAESPPHSWSEPSEPDSGLHSLGYPDQDPVPNSPSSLHQDSVPEPPSGPLHQDLAPVSGAPELHDDLPIVHGGSRLQPAPFPWWLHTDERPPAQWEEGESSHQPEESSHTPEESWQAVPETLPPAPEAQTLHDEANPWWHELYLYTDGNEQASDRASTKWGSWGSETEAFIADETHLHRSFERGPERDYGNRFSRDVRFHSYLFPSFRHLN